MFDSIIIFIANNSLILVYVLAIIKFSHLLIYKRANLSFVYGNFFTVFKERSFKSCSTENVRKYKFLQMHNFLTYSFYTAILICILMHFILP